ncbi:MULTISPECIES: hypothetical protein [Bradyrhizobium]|uniref:hypothetical protein n=1 Tax=Bradyrhizobium elkanii TaxID=29448 RepID=UPI002714EB0B|nr:hypothetical protein [Bradyrhizobium elkanii]WLA49003.1 hypothetical protein QIH80_01720 [Bradyrhizobium elkanii]WLB80763.1 hypothetical protein QIH83_42220 [Bradyrhizobium elkanii]
MFKLNRIVGFIILAALVYGVLQAYGLLPRAHLGCFLNAAARPRLKIDAAHPSASSWLKMEFAAARNDVGL